MRLICGKFGAGVKPNFCGLLRKNGHPDCLSPACARGLGAVSDVAGLLGAEDCLTVPQVPWSRYLSFSSSWLKLSICLIFCMNHDVGAFHIRTTADVTLSRLGLTVKTRFDSQDSV